MLITAVVFNCFVKSNRSHLNKVIIIWSYWLDKQVQNTIKKRRVDSHMSVFTKWQHVIVWLFDKERHYVRHWEIWEIFQWEFLHTEQITWSKVCLRDRFWKNTTLNYQQRLKHHDCFEKKKYLGLTFPLLTYKQSQETARSTITFIDKLKCRYTSKNNYLKKTHTHIQTYIIYYKTS